jgi:glutamyl-tRNA synthetase
VGNARTALFNWLLARGGGGRFVLRIEDTDLQRSSSESERRIVEDLHWLGLEWDEGPDVGGAYGPYRQSERLPLYREHAARLVDHGRAYYCFCSATELDEERQRALAAGEQPKYSGRCRALAPADVASRFDRGAPAAVRFAIPPGGDVTFDDEVRGHVRFARDLLGDFVILRSDGQPAYNFAVVVDDASMAITHVVRGEDHISNTPRQVLLFEAFGYARPQFAHLSLVLGPDHAPLSKRHGATSVAEFRARGYLPDALVNYLALLGWSPGGNDEILPLGELARRFALRDVGKTAGVFDPEKLAWINRQYMRAADAGQLASLLQHFLAAEHFLTVETTSALAYVGAYIVPMVAGAVDRLDEAAARVRFVFDFDVDAALARPGVAQEFEDPSARSVVSALAEALATSPRLTSRDAFRALAGRVREQTHQQGRRLFHPVRVVLTGQADGPELDLAVPAIDSAADLPADAGIAPVLGCRERAAAFARRLAL